MLILYTLHEIHRYLINAIKLESCFLGCELCIFIEERYYFLSKKIFFNCSTVLSNPKHLNATGVLYQRILGIVLLKTVSVFGRFFFNIYARCRGRLGSWITGMFFFRGLSSVFWHQFWYFELMFFINVHLHFIASSILNSLCKYDWGNF